MSAQGLPIFFRRIILPAMVFCLLVGLSLAAPGPAAPAADTQGDAEAGEGLTDANAPAAPLKEATPAGTEVTKAAANPKDAKPEAPGDTAVADPDDEAAAEAAEAESAAVARPVNADPVQVYGWREFIQIQGFEGKLKAKLDTGALTSSIHAEEKELFERDGKKWVRFIVTDPTQKKPARTRLEAPLIRIARIKEPGGDSVAREVVRLSFQVGERKMRGDFTLNNRSNMLAPVLLGRSTIKDLGWVDSARTHLADQKIFR